jgi:hypothetical protein
MTVQRLRGGSWQGMILPGVFRFGQEWKYLEKE